MALFSEAIVVMRMPKPKFAGWALAEFEFFMDSHPDFALFPCPAGPSMLADHPVSGCHFLWPRESPLKR